MLSAALAVLIGAPVSTSWKPRMPMRKYPPSCTRPITTSASSSASNAASMAQRLIWGESDAVSTVRA